MHGGIHVFAEENERALCFEYLQGGSLDKYISSKIMQYIESIIIYE
jgi:hypothetical protein